MTSIVILKKCPDGCSHFVAELLWCQLHFCFAVIALRTRRLSQEVGNVTNGLVATVASYYSTTLEFTELFRMTHSFTNMCKVKLCG